MSDNWIKILETTKKEDELLEYLNKEFTANNIKYKIDLEEKWEGTRVAKYYGKFVLYVQEEFMNQVDEILNKYYENNQIITEDGYEAEMIDEFEDDETEKESKKIAGKQKLAIKIYLGILMGIIMSVIVASIIF